MAIKKKFIEVEMPIIGTNLEVLGTPESLDKKSIKLDLTRKMRGKSVEVIFKIFNKENKLIAYPKKIHLMSFYIRRMMRKRISYVEDSFITATKDIKAKIKPILITRKKVSRAVRKNLRNTTKEFLIDYLKDKTYLELCAEILRGELQKAMLPKLKKIYPLALCDIRVFETSELEKAEHNKPVEIPTEPSAEIQVEKTGEDLTQAIEKEPEKENEKINEEEEKPAKEETREEKSTEENIEDKTDKNKEKEVKPEKKKVKTKEKKEKTEKKAKQK